MAVVFKSVLHWLKQDRRGPAVTSAESVKDNYAWHTRTFSLFQYRFGNSNKLRKENEFLKNKSRL